MIEVGGERREGNHFESLAVLSPVLLDIPMLISGLSPAYTAMMRIEVVMQEEFDSTSLLFTVDPSLTD